MRYPRIGFSWVTMPADGRVVGSGVGVGGILRAGTGVRVGDEVAPAVVGDALGEGDEAVGAGDEALGEGDGSAAA